MVKFHESLARLRLSSHPMQRERGCEKGMVTVRKEDIQQLLHHFDRLDAEVRTRSAPAGSGEAVGLVQVDMGFGKFAVGGCQHPETKVPGIVYLHLRDDVRPLGADTTDMYPEGSEARPDDIAGLIYFHNEFALQQTIDVLLEIQRERYPHQPAPDGEAVVGTLSGKCAECEKTSDEGFALYCVECIEKHGLSNSDFNSGYSSGINGIREDVKQICKDFSDLNDRPYMGDVYAQIDAICDRALSDVPQQKRPAPDATKKPEITLKVEGANTWVCADGEAVFVHRSRVNARLVEAVQEFVDRCERGEVRSTKTYQKFKALLSELAAAGKE